MLRTGHSCHMESEKDKRVLTSLSSFCADHPWLQNAKTAPNVSLGETVRARLKQFTVMNKLKKRALRVIAEHLSDEEASGIREGFQIMDTNQRGKINIDELKIGLQKLGHAVPQDDLQILMDAVSFFFIIITLLCRL